MSNSLKFHIIPNKFFVFILFFSLLQYANAQKPPHLVPISISEMVPVEIDFEKEREFHPDTTCRFVECRNAERTVGYLIEPKKCFFSPVILFDRQFKDCCEVRLEEVQQAETLFARVMDKRTDAAHQIFRGFTAPYFYQYIRQYSFYLNSEGDTCVHINCIHISNVIPKKEEYFHSRMRPDLRYIHVLDGDDDFWNANLNLTRGKLLDYSISGPTIHFVEGRNDEHSGLYQKTLFQNWWPIQEFYSYDQLPTAVKEAISAQIDKTEIVSYEYFSTKYIWTYQQKRNGDGVSRRKRYKKGDYYRIYSDSICHGYDAKGRLLFVGNSEYQGKLDLKYLSHIAEIDTMMAAIKQNMTTRGYDYEKYGYLQWVEQVGNQYVLAVIYNPPIPADLLRAYYTLDVKGEIKGVYLEQR